MKEVDHKDDEDVDEWQATFDPEVFTKANQPLSLDRFRLSEEELKEWAERITKIRAGIETKAKSHNDAEPVSEIENEVPRSRKGHKRSMPTHNPD